MEQITAPLAPIIASLSAIPTAISEIGQRIMQGLESLGQTLTPASAMPELAAVGATGGTTGGPVTNTTNRTVNNNYSITNQGNTQSGDPIEQVRTLRSMYGGAR